MVIALLFLLAGSIAIQMLPVTQYPNIAPSLIQVTATYPGADASTVRDTVIQPIEAQLNGVKRMLYMSSTATDNGAAVINATFDIGTDGDSNTVNVQNRVNWATAALPSEVQQQGVIVKEKSANMLLIITLTSPKGTHDALFLSNFMSIYIKDEIARIPGVGDVMAFGERKYAMRIWVDPDRLASLSMTVDDVIAAIRAQNVQVSAGAVGDPPMKGKIPLRLSISTKGRLATPEEFAEIVIRAEKDGSQVKIRNIAEVELGAENYATAAEVNGKPGALLAVYQLNDANGLAIAEACRAKLELLKKSVFPDDLEYEQINKDAASSAPSANRLIYLPYLNGEQSPHFNLNCRGSFVGLAAIHTKADMTRAVMEGATYALRDILTGIRNCGVRPDAMRMCGGGSKSPFWRQLMADIYNMPVILPDMNSENSAALGVAILAAVGTGEYPSVVDACDHIIKMRDEVYQPDEEMAFIYDKVYQEFDALYPKLKENWKSILDLDFRY